MQVGEQQARELMGLARQTIRAALSGDAPFEPTPPTDPQLLQPAGCFVSLHELGMHKLRGCVGRLDARDPVWQAVCAPAQNVLDDPRFTTDPVRLDELPNLSIEISLLSPLMPAPHPLAFEPMTDGIYLTCQGRSGCFLPQVARETGWTREQLLDRLCLEKMGVPE